MNKQKSIFVICPERMADEITKKKLVEYKQHLESQGYIVHLSYLDTDQKESLYDTCMKKIQPILEANEIHIFFVPTSYESDFDLGMAFLACYFYPDKIIKVIENSETIDEKGQFKLLFEKSLGQMLYDWETNQNQKQIAEKK